MALYPIALPAGSSRRSGFEFACAGTSNKSSSDSLRGKHLIVSDLDYPPYLIIDETKKGNARYSGLDVDIIAAASEILGFSYTIANRPIGANETYSAWLFAAAEESDLVMNYWEKSEVLVSQSVVLNQ